MSPISARAPRRTTSGPRAGGCRLPAIPATAGRTGLSVALLVALVAPGAVPARDLASALAEARAREAALLGSAPTARRSRLPAAASTAAGGGGLPSPQQAAQGYRAGSPPPPGMVPRPTAPYLQVPGARAAPRPARVASSGRGRLPSAVWAPGGAQAGSPRLGVAAAPTTASAPPPPARPPAAAPRPAAPAARAAARPSRAASAASRGGARKPLPPMTAAGIPDPDRQAEAELRQEAFAILNNPPPRGRMLAQATSSGDGGLSPAETAAARARAAAAARRTASSGDRSAAPSTGSKPAAGPGAGELVTVDFKEVDVKTLLRFLAEKTKTNYFMDPAIAAKVTVIGPNPIPLEDAVTFLEAALESRGFTVIDSGSFKRVIPKAQAPKEDTPLYLEPPELPDDKLAQDRTVTEVLQLEHAPVEEVKAAVATLLSQNAVVLAHAQTNKLILTETLRNIARVKRVIAELDVPIRGKSVHLYKLRYRKAEELVTELTSILEKEEVEKRVAPTKQVEAVKPALLPDAVHNLVVLVATRRDADRIMDLIERLDTDPDAGPEVVFLPLEHAEPATIVEKVKAAFALPGEDKALPFTLVPDERTSSLLLRSVSKNLTRRVTDLIQHLDRDVSNEGARVRVYHMEFSEAAKVAEILDKIDFTAGMARGPKAEGQAEDPVAITADENTNSLIITAPRDMFEAIEAVLRELDVVKPQVLVEVLIAEVDYDWAKGVGVDFNFLNSSSSSVNRPFAIGNNDLVEQFLGAAGVANGLSVGMIHGREFDAAAAAGGDFGELSKIAVLSRLFDTTSHANILSAPVLMTSNNEEAKITVGERIQVPASFATAANTGLNTVTAFNTEEVGVILEVTPRITQGDHVVLNVSQQISSRTGDVLGALQTPVIANREVASNVHVKNGETIVIGGLISEEEQRAVNKIPLLGDIPGLGRLFRNRSTSKKKTNLLIFLTPHVIRDAVESAGLTGVARDHIRGAISTSKASPNSEIRTAFRDGRSLGKFVVPRGPEPGDPTSTGGGQAASSRLQGLVEKLRARRRAQPGGAASRPAPAASRAGARGTGDGDGGPRVAVEVVTGGGTGDDAPPAQDPHPGFEVEGL